MSVTHVDGRTRFEFRGHAEAVRLATFMPRFEKGIPFQPVGENLWRLDLDLPREARIEYLLEVEHDGGIDHIRDPANPVVAANPFGTNSVATGPDYTLPGWRRDAPRHRGTIAEIRVASLELCGRRHHHVYSPPDTTPDEPLPLLVVHDGSDYLRYAGLATFLEASGRQVRLLLLEPRERHVEYVGSPHHAAHLVHEVLPHVRRRINVAGKPLVMGASLGAVAAWHAAWTHPGAFDRLLLQSGTYTFAPHPELDAPMFGSIAEFLAAVEDEPRLEGARLALSCGRYESLIEWNRRVATWFERLGHQIRFEEAWAGHDWGAWADRLEGLVGFLLRSPGAAPRPEVPSGA